MILVLVLAMMIGCLLLGGGIYVRDKLLFAEESAIPRICTVVASVGAIIALSALAWALAIFTGFASPRWPS